MDVREHFPYNGLVPTKVRSFISKLGMDFPLDSQQLNSGRLFGRC